MTDVWVSQKKHYCNLCRCWISGNRSNVANHEQSEGHQANQRRNLREMHARERKRQQVEAETAAEIARIESAARAAMNGESRESDVLSRVPASLVPINAARLAQQELLSRPLPSRLTESAPVAQFESFRLPPFAAGPTGRWMVSYDPETKQSVWFNPSTGQTCYRDPTTSEGGGGSLSNEDGRGPAPTEPAVISNLMSVVRTTANMYSEYLRKNMSSEPADTGGGGSIDFVPYKAYAGPRHGMVFREGDLGLGYYREAGKTGDQQTTPDPQKIEKKEIIQTKEDKEAEEKARASQKLIEKEIAKKETKIGEWEVVPESESKIAGLAPAPTQEEKTVRLETKFEEEQKRVELLALKEESESINIVDSSDLRLKEKNSFGVEKKIIGNLPEVKSVLPTFKRRRKK